MSTHEYMRKFIITEAVDNGPMSKFKRFKSLWYVWNEAKSLGVSGNMLRDMEKQSRRVIQECLEHFQLSFYRWLMANTETVEFGDLKNVSNIREPKPFTPDDYTRYVYQRLGEPDEIIRELYYDEYEHKFILTLRLDINVTEHITKRLGLSPAAAAVVTGHLNESDMDAYVEDGDMTEDEVGKVEKYLNGDIEGELHDLGYTMEDFVVAYVRDKVGYPNFVPHMYWPVLEKYQELLGFDVYSSPASKGFEVVDNALDIAHHNSTLGDIVGLTPDEFEDLAHVDVPRNPSKEELEEFYMDVAY